MSNFELQEKAVKAATRFIERKGYELLETGWTSPEGTRIDLIASDEDTLVFIDVTATEYGEGGFEGGKVKRGDLEIAAASWLAGQLARRRNPGPLRHHRHAGREHRQGTPEAPHQRLQLRGRVTDLHPGPRWRAGSPSGSSRGALSCLPAVPRDSLVGRERHGA